ncbi:MAG: ABC transporter substrate-binding protein [Promethearchaeota archaeon]
MKKIKRLILLAFLLCSLFSTFPWQVSATLSAPSNTAADTLNYGVSSLGIDLDPQYAWDSASIDAIDQVCEGLFSYNLTDPSMAIIPNLAESMGTWNENATEYTVKLRKNVTFHDGYAFNASTVVWNFNRLAWLIENKDSQIAELYKPCNDQFVINNIEVVDDYTVKFHLNYPYVPLVGLLCFSGSYMLSPNPTFTPVHEFLQAGNDTLVGTGPFKYDYTIEGKETHFTRYEDYWKGLANVTAMDWIFYKDESSKMEDLSIGKLDMIDYGSSNITQWENNHIIKEKTKSDIVSFIGMENQKINKTFRRAISYAINNNLVNNLYENNNVPISETHPNSIIPDSILYHNPNINPIEMNLTHARQILIDAGLSQGLLPSSTDEEWQTIAESSNPIATYSFGYSELGGSNFQKDLGVLFQSAMKNIGIKINNVVIPLLKSFSYIPPNIFYSSFIPDFNDPSCILNHLLLINPINDVNLKDLMDQGVGEINSTSRQNLYYEIQSNLSEDLMPVALLPRIYSIIYHYDSITSITTNPMRKLSFFSVKWNGNSYAPKTPEIPGYAANTLILTMITTISVLVGIVYLKKK